MAEINLGGDPIFADVVTEESQPILYSQLLGEDDSGVKNKIADNIIIIKDEVNPTASATCTQSENVFRSQQSIQIETDIANIKMRGAWLLCPICINHQCEKHEEMIRHIRMHHGLKPYSCSWCEFSSNTAEELQTHINVHRGLKPHECSYCCFKSASRSDVIKHELTIHNPKNPLKCLDCDNLERSGHSHRVGHRDKKPRKKIESKKFGCDICKITLWNATQQRNHSSLQKQCKLCEFVTCSESSYKTHLQEDHGIKSGKKGSKTKKKKDLEILFQCALCPWSSKSKPKILLHLIHHPNQAVGEDIVDITVLRKCGIMK